VGIEEEVEWAVFTRRGYRGGSGVGSFHPASLP